MLGLVLVVFACLLVHLNDMSVACCFVCRMFDLRCVFVEHLLFVLVFLIVKMVFVISCFKQQPHRPYHYYFCSVV